MATSNPIEAWWTAFASKTDNLDALFTGKEEWDLVAWMHEQLGAVHPEIMWEYGPAVNQKGHRLVFTPEGNRELRPLVRALLQQAPQIDGWEFYAYRLAESLEEGCATIEARTGDAMEGVMCQVRLGDYHFVELMYSADRFDAENEDNFNAAFVATEVLLGEETLDHFIGSIEVSDKLDAEWPAAVPLAELPQQVEQVLAELNRSLPDTPWHLQDVENIQWASIKLEPEEADDYARQDDLLVAVTPVPEARENALRGLSFSSRRHSRHGERFCYLKIDGSDGLEATSWDDRGEIEDAIDHVLRDACLGSTIGGGTGLLYSYIELALTDVPRAWSEIRKVLQAGHLAKRTWLLFHDTDDQSLWRGLYDDTPAPPVE